MPAARAGSPAVTDAPAPGVLTVGEVARRIRAALRDDALLQDVWVEGEIGRVMISSAGHAYFSLKDERGVLDCVLFARELSAVTFEPRTGLRVLAHGRVDMYEAQGKVQLYVDVLRPAGVGDLALRFEALKARLAAEGLFDPARRRALPARPRRVAVVTSPTGAVWHDVRTVVARRWPLTELVLVPCLVQGEAAPPTIVDAFGRIAALPAEDLPDVVILARGGGSLEDLWAFNAEAVVRAVVACPVPVVVGVGHEIDVTLADFAADVRAPTPSAAAELVVPDRARVRSDVDALARRATRAMDERAGDAVAVLAGGAQGARPPGSRGHPRVHAGTGRVAPRRRGSGHARGPGVARPRDGTRGAPAPHGGGPAGRDGAREPRRRGRVARRARPVRDAPARLRDRPPRGGRPHRPRVRPRSPWATASRSRSRTAASARSSRPKTPHDGPAVRPGGARDRGRRDRGGYHRRAHPHPRLGPSRVRWITGGSTP